jgi:hypothetical protein
MMSQVSSYDEVLAALRFALQELPVLNERISLEERRSLLTELKNYPAWVERVRNQVPMRDWYLIEDDWTEEQIQIQQAFNEQYDRDHPAKTAEG